MAGSLFLRSTVQSFYWNVEALKCIKETGDVAIEVSWG